MDICKKCGKALDSDDIGATAKFISRSALDFMCVPCIAKELYTTEEYLRARIEFLKRNGCTAFPDKK